MLDPHAIKSAIRKVKDLQYTDVEIKVRDATNNDPWGTKTALLQEIADATHNYEEYPRLFSMLWRRLTDINHVMHVQKALILIEYLLRNGADRFIRDAKQRSRDIQKLKKYKHYDQNSEDDAKDARIKAKRVFDLLTNDKLLQEARQQAEKIKGMRLTGTEGGDRYGGAYSGGGYSGGGTSGGHEKEPDRYSTFTPQELAERNGTDGEQQQQKPRKPTKKKDEDEDEEENEQQDDPFGPPQELGGGDSKKTKSSTKDKSGQETVAPKKTTTKKKKEKKKKPEVPKDQEKEKPKNIPKPTVDGDDPFSAQFEEEDDEDGGFQPRKGESNQPSSTNQSKSKGGGGFDKFAAAFDEGSSQNIDFLSSDHNTTNKQIDFDKLRVTDKQKDGWDLDSDKNKQTPTTTKSNTPDDPWNSLTSLDNLSTKPVQKKEAPPTGKSMASMKSSQPQALDLGGTNPFADSPFATGPQQQQQGGGRGGQPGGYYQQPYQGGFPQGPYGGGPYGGGPYGGGGFVPNPGYGTAPTPYGGGGFGGPSQPYDPFASLSGPQMQGRGNQNKPTQAFDNLSW